LYTFPLVSVAVPVPLALPELMTKVPLKGHATPAVAFLMIKDGWE
jgi:hypothetical protein